MQSQTHDNENVALSDELLVKQLYIKLLKCWNENMADEYSALFTDDASLIGFDGSQMNGRREIQKEIGEIFSSHKVGAYVSIVREVRFAGPGVFMLRAVAGMLPPVKQQLIPR